jgi:hypothetical protein
MEEVTASSDCNTRFSYTRDISSPKRNVITRMELRAGPWEYEGSSGRPDEPVARSAAGPDRRGAAGAPVGGNLVRRRRFCPVAAVSPMTTYDRSHVTAPRRLLMSSTDHPHRPRPAWCVRLVSR